MKKQVAKIKGNVKRIFNGDDIACIGSAVNINAEVLHDLIERVEELERCITERMMKHETD